jgi:hypothetical protein
MINGQGGRRQGRKAQTTVSEVEAWRVRDGNDDMTIECEVGRDDDKVRRGYSGVGATGMTARSGGVEGGATG